MKDTRKKELIGKVRTREAPSPTGMPHVGTAMQAMFNWVLARRYQGQFILRIEDTDRKRLVPGSEAGIMEALDWLGVSPDESPTTGGPYAPYRQSERLTIYRKYAQQLVTENKAYYCFCSPERLVEMRKKQQQAGIPPKYDGCCKKVSLADAKKRLAAGEKGVIRLKVPADREIIVHDLIRGEVKFDSNLVDDQVLLKSDGFPTYHLGVVVDDHLMKITHMKRGEEWLPSAPKHVLLYEYFGWQLPVMLHTPTLRNPDRSKLSKRKGNTALWWYREQGFLPEALLNFLALLLWKPQDQREIFTKEEMLEEFEWSDLNVTGPIFDIKKLTWLNGVYIRKKESQLLSKEVKAWAQWVATNGAEQSNIDGVKQILAWMKERPEFFAKTLTLAQERLKLFSELPNLLSFYFEQDLAYDREDLLQKQDSKTIIQALLAVKQALAASKDYNAESWEQTVRSCADKADFKHKVLFMSMRAAIAARRFTPPLFEVMEVLGKEESFRRIDEAVKFLRR